MYFKKFCQKICFYFNSHIFVTVTSAAAGANRPTATGAAARVTGAPRGVHDASISEPRGDAGAVGRASTRAAAPFIAATAASRAPAYAAATRATGRSDRPQRQPTHGAPNGDTDTYADAAGTSRLQQEPAAAALEKAASKDARHTLHTAAEPDQAFPELRLQYQCPPRFQRVL